MIDICLIHILTLTPIHIAILPLILQKELAKSITLEQGKTLADAEGDVFRGLRKFIGLLLSCIRARLSKGNIRVNVYV